MKEIASLTEPKCNPAFVDTNPKACEGGTQVFFLLSDQVDFLISCFHQGRHLDLPLSPQLTNSGVQSACNWHPRLYVDSTCSISDQV